MRSTFGRLFNTLRSSWDINSSLFALPDGAALIRPTKRHDMTPGRIKHLCRHPTMRVTPRNPSQDRAPGE
ncbi:hypothetical protein LFZ92_05060 [Salmonella enterica subsp. salamae serovar 57:z29:z42]|nr:hypothetical protein LFZ92_05060 [Salmonella enterica subsp. salamae serovar 57:z29:z42]ECI0413388.1 hypothetical protein [Salmonella enterica subsp. salamae]EDW4020556.1 hypothetical protein [Salmonella enterica subsp. salamae]